jgi:hypothetical protein
MTTNELCELVGVTQYEFRTWLESGLVEGRSVSIPGRHGRHFEFDAGQLARARLLKELHRKGVPLDRLAGIDLGFNEQRYVVYDGDRLRGCRDATTAIAAVIRAKCWCSAMDLSTIPGGVAE